jgi:two-component system sensor histidine kinase/response regulator
MKGWVLVILWMLATACYAQENLGNPDSLKIKLNKTPADTTRVLLLCDIAYSYRYNNVDSANYYATKVLKLSQQLNYEVGVAWAYLLRGVTYAIQGNVPIAISYCERSIQLADSLHHYTIVSRALANIGWCAFDLEDYYRAIDYFKRSLKYQQESIGQAGSIITLQMNIGQAYLAIKNIEEAELYLKKAAAWGKEKNPNFTYLLNLFSALRLEQKKYASADSMLTVGWKLINALPDKIDKADNRYYFAKLKLAQGEIQSALDYAVEARGYYQMLRSKVDLERIYELLSTIESRRGRTQQSLDYLLISTALRDSVRNSNAWYSEFLFDQHEQEKQLMVQQKDKELLQAEQRRQQIIWIGSLIIFISVTSGLCFFVWQKQQTNKKLLELNDELIRKEATIADHNNLLKETNLSKDKLFSIIGHDLRSPLLSLTGFLKLLSQQSDTLSKEELKKFLVELDGSLKNLFNLLENLLEWSLSHTGTIDLKPEVFDITHSLKENGELLKDQAASKNIMIVNEGHSGLLVSAHSSSIHSVIRNLISNAIKFTPEGGKITLHAEPVGRYVRVMVMDTGWGISQEVIQKLFKIGVKHSTLGTAKEKGSGLGLVLCKDFVEKNGGTIGVESEEGKGSTFYFSVPMPGS